MTLTSAQRSAFERTIKSARQLAEAGATEALATLGVGEAAPFAHLSPEQRALRNRLRARGRAVGDARTANKSQEIHHLASLVAYEHWHRMLFARFLAENDLLLDPEHQVALALTDVEEIAREEGENLWALAGSFAQTMLPGIFRADDAILELSLPVETQRSLENLLQALPSQTFTATDSLGWTYQYWQADRKDEVNRTNGPRGADEIPAVTQLFTEDYMVEFLLHNTIGKAWAEQTGIQKGLPEKEGLSVDWKYLRLPEPGTETQELNTENCPLKTPASGWKLLDPSMGSGHFLTFALPILTRLRMESEGLAKADAVLAVLRENLHGLELDPRCCQIGAFNLALTAWRLLGGYQKLPPLNIACCGLPIRATKQDWRALAPGQENLTDQLHDLFSQAPVLGSLIDPARQLYELQDAEAFNALLPILEESLKKERAAGHFEEAETGVTARGLTSAYHLLRQSYDLVITNVPYLGSGKQDPKLKDHIEKYYKDGKKDLATAFVLRALNFLSPGGTTALVTPQNWLFLGSYKHLRKDLLEHAQFDSIARLGEHGFQSSAAAGAFTALITLTRRTPDKATHYLGLDVSAEPTPADKNRALQENESVIVPQISQLDNPDGRIGLDKPSEITLLSDFANGLHGMGSKDSPCFFKQWWEIQIVNADWEFMQTTTDEICHDSGLEQAIFWEQGNGLLIKRGLKGEAVLAGQSVWSEQGVNISQMRHLPASLYRGAIFDKNTAVVYPKVPINLPAIWCFCSSPQFNEEVRKIDQKLNVTNATLVKVPFDLAHWQKIADEKYPDGLPEPYSNDPTQWLFKGHIDDTAPEHILHVAAARLLGYRWPAELDAKKAGVKILPEDEAHWKLCAPHADEDGIVCLPALNQEASASDRLTRLLGATLLATPQIADLIAATGSKKKNLADWLRDDFFKQHCKLFGHRPFLWHLWDGRPDGFHALVNYHQLAAPNGAGRKTLETLTFTYLGDWIRRQQDGITNQEPGAEDRLAAALQLKTELENILAGEPPYDLFIRWKPLHQQPAGWEPDINDGVRLNIRPFMLARDMKKKDAGLLREKPNLHWKKDRGKEPERPKEEFPWFWTWDEETKNFQGTKTHDGSRHNALHYSLATKQAAQIIAL